ncbi:hypothetical protein BP6252_06756 [Coleophoma cylindrospora]|uniref:Zn(2)-C6 fungal-type domain-containing protein n=1 Tax=Coleophoma cylindrospora TaxID=1849047 RepID=A0A3D8RFM3_9HELO|nr:hypothetical protein BP6252_06756 [Coleophoma cylindrospora]
MSPERPHSQLPPRMQVQSPVVGPAGTARPYRSHKIRACDLCRKRKSRCAIDTAGQPCTLCLSQGVQCQFNKPKTPHPQIEAQPRGLAKGITRSRLASTSTRHRPSASRPPLDQSHQWSFSDPTGKLLSTSESRGPRLQSPPIANSSQSTHIVGPVAAQDAQVLEQYMSPDDGRPQEETSQTRYELYSVDPAKPVLYTLIPRRREGLPMTSDPGSKERAILDQILMPMQQEIITRYMSPAVGYSTWHLVMYIFSFFEQFNSSFPMLDNAVYSGSYTAWNKNVSQTIICEIYAIALTYWNQSRGRAEPSLADHRFVWNLAVKALRDDFMAPGLSTVQAALLDLTGRPIYSMTGNGINNGRTLSLSYSLGLNRDPSRWNLSGPEKDVRIRMWWGVLIHDRWGSFAHKTPPHIFNAHYDVPLPQLGGSQLQAGGFASGEQRFLCFLQLCSLTEILGGLLPLVYDLRTSSQKEIMRKVRRLKADLDQWEDSLSDFISMTEEKEAVVSGSSSLKLGYLAIKMLICRIELHSITHSSTSDTIEVRQYHQAECRNSAKTIVDFIVSLKTSNLHEFWLPYSAYHLGSAATLLLRCALETTDEGVAQSCVSSARALVSRLRRAREEDDWDLADYCLLQCEGVLHRMTTHVDQQHHQNIAPMPTPLDLASSGNYNEAPWPLGANETGVSSDIHFHDLWDMFRFEESDFV